MMDAVTQILSLLGNPSQLLNLIPNPVTWPTLTQDALRAYKVDHIAYWMGLFFLLLGLVSAVLGYMTGNRGMRTIAHVMVIGILWALLTKPPVDQCIENSGYPCVVEKTVKLVRPSEGGFTYYKEKLDFKGAVPEGGVYLLRHKDRSIAVEEAKINFPPYIKYEYTHPLPYPWDKVEEFWWFSSNTANNNIVASLARYQEGIEAARSQLVGLAVTAFSINTVGAITDAGLYALTLALANKVGQRNLKEWLFSGLKVFGLGAASQGVNTGIAIIVEIFKTMALVLAITPLAIMLTYGFIVATAGFTFYLTLVLFPIFIGLGAIFGFRPVAFPLQLMLVSLITPIVVAPLMGASLHMLYGYNASVQQFLETSSDRELMGEVKTKDSPLNAFIASTVVNAMAKQLYNTYICLSPYFSKDLSGQYIYGDAPFEGPYLPATGGVATCFDVDASEKRLALPLRWSRDAQKAKNLDLAINVPIKDTGKKIESVDRLKKFFSDLAAYTNDGNVTMLELSSPQKLRQLRNIALRYGITFSGVSNKGEFSEIVKEIHEKLSKEDRAVFSQAAMLKAYDELGKAMGTHLQSYPKRDELAQFRFSQSLEDCNLLGDNRCLPGGSETPLRILDRILLANMMGLEDDYLSTGGLTATALSTLVSAIVSLALSIVVIGATWGIMGAVFGAAVQTSGSVLEPPGLSGFSGLMNLGGAVRR